MDGLGNAENRRRRRLIWLLVFLPLAGIIVAVGLPLAWWVTTSTTCLNDALSDLKAAGIPTTLREIIPPPVPDAENAALVYERAWTDLGGLPKDVADITKSLTELPPREWPRDAAQKLSAYLKSNAPAVDLTKRAARLDKCRFPLDYSAGLGMRLPHLPQMRELTRLMRLDSLDQLGGGNFEGAVSSALTGMRVGRHCETDASMLSKLCEIACHAIASDTLGYTLRYGNPSPAQLDGLLTRLEREAPDTDMRRALAAEIGVTCDIYDRLRTGGPVAGHRSKGGKGAPAWWMQLALRHDEAFCLRAMLQYTELANKPYYQVKAQSEAIDDEVDDAGWTCYFAKTLTLRSTGAFAAASRAEAQHQVLRLGVALMIYEKEHGVFPDALGALAPDIIPEVPVDPFSGKPYVYRREDGGFVVYSLDRNMKDDSGVSSRDVGKDKGDIVFRLGHRQ